MPELPNNSNKLCHAGQLLEGRLQASTDMLHGAAERMERSSEKVLQSVALLNEYAIRDKEKLESLEKQYDRLDEARACGQKLKTTFAEHLGEHRESKRIEGIEGRNAGRKYGTSSGVVSGITSGILSALMAFWYWLSHSGQ